MYRQYPSSPDVAITGNDRIEMILYRPGIVKGPVVSLFVSGLSG